MTKLQANSEKTKVIDKFILDKNCLWLLITAEDYSFSLIGEFFPLLQAVGVIFSSTTNTADVFLIAKVIKERSNYFLTESFRLWLDQTLVKLTKGHLMIKKNHNWKGNSK